MPEFQGQDLSQVLQQVYQGFQDGGFNINGFTQVFDNGPDTLTLRVRLNDGKPVLTQADAASTGETVHTDSTLEVHVHHVPDSIGGVTWVVYTEVHDLRRQLVTAIKGSGPDETVSQRMRDAAPGPEWAVLNNPDARDIWSKALSPTLTVAATTAITRLGVADGSLTAGRLITARNAASAPPLPPPLPDETTAAAGPDLAGVGVGGAAGAAAGSAAAGIIGFVIALLALLVPIVAAFAQNVASSGTAGATLTGCHGTGTALDKSGSAVSNVAAPGGGGSSPEHPFVVDKDGTVPWSGSSDSVITNHSWSVSVYGIEVKSGGSKNDKKTNDANGTEKVKDYLKVPVVGLFQVSGDITGNGGSCSGDMWVKLAGSPLGTPLWFGGLVLLLGGLALGFFARPSMTEVQ